MNSLLSIVLAMGGLLSPFHDRIDVPYQALAGNWQVVDMKETITDTKTGETQDINKAEPGMLDELKKTINYDCLLGTDHSVVMHSGFKGSKARELKGTYTLEGDKLRFKGTTPDAFKEPKGGGSPMVIPDFVTLSFQGEKMIWHYAVQTVEEGRTLRFDIYLIWQRK